MASPESEVLVLHIDIMARPQHIVTHFGRILIEDVLWTVVGVGETVILKIACERGIAIHIFHSPWP